MMLWSRRIGLADVTTAPDAIGNQVETETVIDVFANPINITATERIALTQSAGFIGFCDIRRFEIHGGEYDWQPYVYYADNKYSVISVQHKRDKVWLTCRRSLKNAK
jgi:hypothetical protein